MPKYSLIIATLNRPDDLHKALASFCTQTYKNFEVIIVDQSTDNRTEEVSRSYTGRLNIRYIRSPRPGLSHNRNLGLSHACGEIVSFPDDDCEYDTDTLEKIEGLFGTSKADIVSCNQRDRQTGRKILKVPDDAISLTPANILHTVISISIFVKLRQRGDIRFDERLGAGTYFGSGEETDMILALLDKGYTGHYSPFPYVFHVTEDVNYDTRRAYRYGLGFGAMFKKEIFLRKNYAYMPLFLKFLFRPFAGIFVSRHRRYYFNSLKGRISGFIKFKV